MTKIHFKILFYFLDKIICRNSKFLNLIKKILHFAFLQRLPNFIGFIFFILVTGTNISPENQTPSQLFIIDASGSMNEYLGIYQKIHLAKKHVSRYISTLPQETEIGFLAYGNRLPGCSSSRLYQPLEVGNHDTFKNRLFSLTPSGATPLAESIRIAGNLISQRKKETEIILVTDGVESCYGDPKKELQTLKQKGIPFRFHVLGLGLKPHEELQMKALTEDGKYFSIEDDSSFYTALDSLKNPSSTITKETFQRPDDPNTKPNNDLMVWFEKIHKNQESDSMIEYTIDFGFKAKNNPNNCVIFNLKQKKNFSHQSLGPKRISSPETLILNKSACFDVSESKGTITIEIPKQNSLIGVLELWDMTGIPSPLEISKEEEIR
ncbi:vWA domain-containing protein [Leptospira kirschneri]|uniref:vWA domain-containing protein n=1 Tax=Leptospira kirschneri TaxID=29507 RepID=UPI0002BFFAD7|nr:VWA domain-containing protein [Leptospira kirschneri]EMN27727.1 von Willebrand factor type A domain protein [Leptospira kirschneri serovar Sokoine str. RM1]EMO80781.1 von Willebrand factor type A domain protein [Leptospira kirschneri str. 200801774]EPG48560.1 von Willebrand factor type A domain protein [Leptospira kirschneri serovar Cynopteri str. 3522 CT]